MDALKFSNVSIAYANTSPVPREVVRGLSTSITRGERISLVGPNGSGKTSILRVITGALKPTEGSVTREAALQDIGYMPQNFRTAIFPWLSARRHFSLYARRSVISQQEGATRHLNQLSLSLNPAAQLHAFSGGEQQLFLLALILARQPTLLLLDEPFAAVDVRRRPIARALVRSLSTEMGATLVLISHELEDAAELTDRAIVLTGDPSDIREIRYHGNRNEFSQEIRNAVRG